MCKKEKTCPAAAKPPVTAARRPRPARPDISELLRKWDKKREVTPMGVDLSVKLVDEVAG